MLIAASLTWLAAISKDGSWNPILLGFMFIFCCYLFFSIHFVKWQVAFSIKFWDNHPTLEALKFCIFSLPCFYSAYEAWTGIELFPDPRRPSIAIYYANLIGDIPITLFFISLGFFSYILVIHRTNKDAKIFRLPGFQPPLE